MQAVVKKPHIEIKSTGELPARIISFFEKEYGKNFKIIEDEEYIDVTKTDWYRDIKKKLKSGDYLRIYRMNANMTQEELGKKLGSFTRQNVSEMEKGKRGISKDTARKLSQIFNKPIDKFI